MSNPGYKLCLNLNRQMIIGDTTFFAIACEKFNEQLDYIKYKTPIDYDSFYSYITSKYNVIDKYPIFLLDEYLEPHIFEEHPDILFKLINNWIYNTSLEFDEIKGIKFLRNTFEKSLENSK